MRNATLAPGTTHARDAQPHKRARAATERVWRARAAALRTSDTPLEPRARPATLPPRSRAFELKDLQEFQHVRFQLTALNVPSTAKPDAKAISAKRCTGLSMRGTPRYTCAPRTAALV